MGREDDEGTFTDDEAHEEEEIQDDDAIEEDVPAAGLPTIDGIPQELIAGIMSGVMAGMSPDVALKRALASLPPDDARRVAKTFVAHVEAAHGPILAAGADDQDDDDQDDDQDGDDDQDDDDGEYGVEVHVPTLPEFLNDFGAGISELLDRADGAELGITIEKSEGRYRVRVAALIPTPGREDPTPFSRKRGPAHRLGDVIQLVLDDVVAFAEIDEAQDEIQDDED